ncbi:Dot/Icm T4SS effector kinase LegK1 [uncultured Legionella sp.]|uniref:Dot/Icm T4SS effector kinase LegK1 n=1 Tax=uncultured Legionella sp. TaxID=210934 RepID=UPI00263A2802|nr:Dot/Icm T4SS effector kinase LegK1 [uncultured Legionella sp.]
MIHKRKIYIDPRTLHQSNFGISESHAALLSFFDAKKISTVWHSKEDYEYTYNHINYQFNFSQSIIKRPRKEGKSGFRFDLFDPDQTPKGRGGYAVVYPIVATFIHNEEGLIEFKSSKKKLVKIQDHTASDRTGTVIQEYKNLQQAGHLRVKEPVFSKSERINKSYLIMEDVEGFTLEQIVNPDKRVHIINEIPRLTVYKRLQLTLEILRAIQEQTVGKNLLHRDIKPGNIIVDLNQNPPRVKLIDFGFAITLHNQDYRRLGTRAYRPPESFDLHAKYSTKSDIYSTGRLLSYLWGDDYNNYYIDRTKDFDYIRSKSTNVDLFSLPEIDLFLDEVDKNRIRGYLDSMINVNPGLRPNIDLLIEQFSSINAKQYSALDIPKYSNEHLQQFAQKLKPDLLLINQHLKLMKKKQHELIDRDHIDAANAMSKLIITIERNTCFLQENLNPDYMLRHRKSCLDAINTSQKILKNHRDSYWIVAEIATAIALLGAGYLVALGINYCYSGRVGLFSQTKSSKLAESLNDMISVMGEPVSTSHFI